MRWFYELKIRVRGVDEFALCWSPYYDIIPRAGVSFI